MSDLRWQDQKRALELLRDAVEQFGEAMQILKPNCEPEEIDVLETIQRRFSLALVEASRIPTKGPTPRG